MTTWPLPKAPDYLFGASRKIARLRSMAAPDKEHCEFLDDANDEQPEEELSDLYDMTGQQQVTKFLSANTGFIPTLRDAAGQARHAFGTDVRLVMDVVSDSGKTVLRITVETPLGVRDALASMNRFYDDWWLDRGVKERSLIAWSAHPDR